MTPPTEASCPGQVLMPVQDITKSKRERIIFGNIYNKY